MVQLGFVLDQSRCIGCHACTVACKSENDVPVGSFRTWVKYTEAGEFPEVKRSFTVLRCNQCTDAPCMEICPTSALFKRKDGIVDLDQDACIGCKSCMQGCPYDALYINPVKGTAEKCHFCAHRTEMGLAPACAVVCPTEAIIPGDFDDPKSRVRELLDTGRLTIRKEEAGTKPNVYYREASAGGTEPLTTSSAGGYLWSNQKPGLNVDAEAYRATVQSTPSRTTYDVPHETYWGWRVGLYLWTKSISAGLFLTALPALLGGELTRGRLVWSAGGSLLFLLITSALLVADLKRPERFLLILRRPNWNSWLVKGSLFLMGYGALLGLWLLLAAADAVPTGGAAAVLGVVTAAAGLGTASYTAFLFGQAKGRVLWMQRGLSLHLAVQAVVAGTALALVVGPALGLPAAEAQALGTVLLQGLVVHLLFAIAGGNLAPNGREKEYLEAHHLLTRGPFARAHWIQGVGLGILAPVLLLLVGGGAGVAAVAGVLALAGLLVEEDLFVKAGQALPIS